MESVTDYVLPGTPEAEEFLASFPQIVPVEGRFNSSHDKLGKFATKSGAPSTKEMPATEKPNVTPDYIKPVKDPVSGDFFGANTGSSWQSNPDLEKRAGGVWSEYHDGMHNTRQIIRNRNNGRPDMENVDPERGWLTQYQRVGEVQYGHNGPRLGEVIREGKMYSKEDMGVDLRNAATVLQHKLDTAPTHRSPLYRGMRMNRKDLPTAGATFQSDISSWSKSRDSAEVFAYGAESTRLGIVGDHRVVMRMVGSKKSADIGGIVASGIMDDEHIASGKYRVRRVTRKGLSVNVEVEQIND